MHSRPLFVYGTLLRGEVRHPSLSRHGIRRAEPAKVRGYLVDLGTYPGYLREYPADATDHGVPVSSSRPADGEVVGECVWVEQIDDCLQTLDEIEGYSPADANSLYLRELIEVRLEDGLTRAEAWIYHYNRPLGHGAKLISNGDWRSVSSTNVLEED